jgi:hypothetical protein
VELPGIKVAGYSYKGQINNTLAGVESGLVHLINKIVREIKN